LRLKPKFANARDDPLDLFLGSVWLRDDDHISGSGIMRMAWAGIFCKPRYNAEQSQMFRSTSVFSHAQQTSCKASVSDATPWRFTE
jgi:hypothetical protein